MRVLYVCTGNSFRSPIAEALTRKYHPDLDVESAGTDPADCIAMNGAKLLANADALEYCKEVPDVLTERAIDDADTIIAMQQHHKHHIHDIYDEYQVHVWNVRDPIHGRVSPEHAFEKIDQLVQAEFT